MATTTEIHDYLRLLFARIGVPYCHICGRRIEKQTVDQIVDRIFESENGSHITVLAPIVRGKKGEYKTILSSYHKMGFLNARVDGKRVQTTQELSLERYKKHAIEIIVDELRVDRQDHRFQRSLEMHL